MPIDIPTRIAFLRKIHLFYGMKDKDFETLAEELDELTVPRDGVIFNQDDKPDAFYLIYSGSVRIVRKQDRKEHQIALLVKNDYFGEMALVANRRRSGTAYALSDCTMLVLSRADFHKLFKSAPDLTNNLELSVLSRRLARKLNFKWVRPDEVIYFLARKHRIILYQTLLAPALWMALPAGLALLWYFFIPNLLVGLLALLSFLAALVWMVWRRIDWGNDYYVVTNQRVVYLEKVVGVYDSRQEAPLNMIASVGVETNQFGKWLDYGNVNIRTFVGKIVFANVNHPAHAGKMIEEYWNRTKEGAAAMEKEAMKNAIRKRLGLPMPKMGPTFGEPAPVPRTESPPPKMSAGMMAILKFLGANTLKLRYEAGESVIYRKHWVVLVVNAWISVVGAAGSLLLFLARLVQLALLPEETFVSFVNGFSMDSWALAFLIASAPFASWFGYQLADWSNDKYEVTNEQIVDIDRTPFGTETRNAAPLESILGTSYERKGLLGNLFNFGTVFITVGGTKLAFEDVMDPATVLSDIDRRRMARKAKQDEARIASERDRMAEWIATYHRAAEQFREEEKRNQKPNPPKANQ